MICETPLYLLNYPLIVVVNDFSNPKSRQGEERSEKWERNHDLVTQKCRASNKTLSKKMTLLFQSLGNEVVEWIYFSKMQVCAVYCTNWDAIRYTDAADAV